MSRIRTIKPEFWTSEQVVECSTTARLLFIGLWNFVDDGGNIVAASKAIKMKVFPGDDFSVSYVDDLISELLTNGLLVPYKVDGVVYWHVTGWKHQKIEKPSFKYPQFEEAAIIQNSTTIRRPFDDCHPAEGSLMESNGKDSTATQLSETSSDVNSNHKKVRLIYSEAFEEFWKSYPTDDLMSKKAAYVQWLKLDDIDKQKATRSVPAFRAYCKDNPTYRPVHACRYISDRRFDGFSKTMEAVASITMCSVRQNTPAGQAWENYSRLTKGKGIPWTNGVWRFPTEYPPQLRAAE